MKLDFSAESVAELSAYVGEMVAAIQQGQAVSEADLQNLQTIVNFLNGLDVTGTGAHVREGIPCGCWGSLDAGTAYQTTGVKQALFSKKYAFLLNRYAPTNHVFMLPRVGIPKKPAQRAWLVGA